MATQPTSGSPNPSPDEALQPAAGDPPFVEIVVRNLERAYRFSTEGLGLRPVGEVEAMKMRFYPGSRGTHHQLAPFQVGRRLRAEIP